MDKEVAELQGRMAEQDGSVYVADVKLRHAAKLACHSVNPDIEVYEGRIVSGDQFISDQEKKKYIVKMFKGLCTEKEGAAVAHTAYLNNVPFLIIRAISDKSDSTAEVDYPIFQRQAIDRSVKLVIELLKRI